MAALIIFLLTVWILMIVAKVFVLNGLQTGTGLDDYINSRKPSNASEVERFTREFYSSAKQWH